MRRGFVLGLGAVLGVALWLPSSSSEACLHAIQLAEEDAAVKVARAERLLTEGRPQAAFAEARRARRQLERGADARAQALLRRAWAVTAVAVTRMDGRVPIAPESERLYVTRGREERSLRWAIRELRARVDANPNDPRAELHLAEALARVPAHRDVARAILVHLDDRDLVTDAHGYATLARLSDPGSADWSYALSRCQRMASTHASRICPSASAPGS
jgi:predicted Zn-dependent protease